MRRAGGPTTQTHPAKSRARALRGDTRGTAGGFHIQDHTWLAADIELPATPGTEHMAWSALKPMRDARTSGSSSVMSDVRMRYRVVEQM